MLAQTILAAIKQQRLKKILTYIVTTISHNIIKFCEGQIGNSFSVDFMWKTKTEIKEY
jgi:hypothetical protein